MGSISEDTGKWHEKEGGMKFVKQGVLVLCMIAFCAVGLIGCEKEGPAEKAGKKIDQAFDAAKKKVEEATE